MKQLLKTVCTILCLLTVAYGVQTSECWLCRRASPPNPLKSVSYTEARTVKHDLCPFCLKDKPRCSICSGPTTAGKEVDGRIICADCKKVAIDTPAELDTLYSEVRRYVETLTGVKVDAVPPVQLVASDELDTRFAESSGRSFQAHAFYKPYNPEIIYALSGHSAYDLGPTLAHEFTHAWQSRNAPQQDRMLVEGFATWVGYKYAESKGYRERMSGMLRSADPDYGEGLARCLAIEKKSGVKGLVAFVRTNGKFDPK